MLKITIMIACSMLARESASQPTSWPASQPTTAPASRPAEKSQRTPEERARIIEINHEMRSIKSEIIAARKEMRKNSTAAKRKILLLDGRAKSLTMELLEINRGLWSPSRAPEPLTAEQLRIQEAKKSATLWAGMTLDQAKDVLHQTPMTVSANIDGTTTYAWFLERQHGTWIRITGTFQGNKLVRFHKSPWYR